VTLDDLEPDDENWAFDPVPESPDDLRLSFDRYVTEGIQLLEEWMRDPD
jgi:hypothetical protein